MKEQPPAFLNEPIGQGEIDTSTPPPSFPLPTSFGAPIKSHIFKIGHSAAAVIPLQVLRNLGFKEGDYINITIQHRQPDPKELERKQRKQRKKKRHGHA